MLFPTFKTKCINFCLQYVMFSSRFISNISKQIWCTKIISGRGGGGVLESENLYPIYPLFPCSDFFISNVEGGGGNVFLAWEVVSPNSR